MAEKHPYLLHGPLGSQMGQQPQEDGHRDRKGTLSTVPGNPLYKTIEQRKERGASKVPASPKVSTLKPPGQLGLEVPRLL